ncbi:MAG: PorT family protein [Chitinophagaceae bacterium]|nr:PorT family protein [Chitinophagaceae bacterium]
MKRIFVLSVFTLIGFTIQAQVNFGVKAGANLTKFSGSDAEDNDFLLGYAGGGFVNYKLADVVSLQGEVLYSLEGVSNKFEEEDFNVKAKIKAGYINIPILVQYNHSSGFYAETGPQLGILASAKYSVSGGGENHSYDVKDQFKSINFSWGIGAGYKLSNGIGIGARYNLGLMNIIDDGSNVKTGGFHIGLSYTFGGGNE